MCNFYKKAFIVIAYLFLYVMVASFSAYTSAIAYIDSGRAFEASIDFVCFVMVVFYSPLAIYVSYLLVVFERKFSDLLAISLSTVLILATTLWLSYYFELGLLLLVIESVFIGGIFYYLFGGRSSGVVSDAVSFEDSDGY